MKYFLMFSELYSVEHCAAAQGAGKTKVPCLLSPFRESGAPARSVLQASAGFQSVQAGPR